MQRFMHNVTSTCRTKRYQSDTKTFWYCEHQLRLWSGSLFCPAVDPWVFQYFPIHNRTFRQKCSHLFDLMFLIPYTSLFLLGEYIWCIRTFSFFLFLNIPWKVPQINILQKTEMWREYIWNHLPSCKSLMDIDKIFSTLDDKKCLVLLGASFCWCLWSVKFCYLCFQYWMALLFTTCNLHSNV